MADSFVFITGASSGMGEATAYRLSKNYNLILNGRDSNRLNSVAKECEKNGHRVIPFCFDLVNASSVRDAVQKLISENQIEVESFLHFAGMTDLLSADKTKYSVGLEVMNVNYFSAVEIISCLLRKRVNGKNLRNVVLVSSIVTEGGQRYQPHYCASKGALNSLCLALACELAPNVRVNVISPGSFKTRITETLFVDPNNTAWNPPTLLPPGQVDEVAKVAEFLISENASYLTGQNIFVDGGEHFRWK